MKKNVGHKVGKRDMKDCGLEAVHFGSSLHSSAEFLPSVLDHYLIRTVWRKGKMTDRTGILWPDAVGNDKLLHVNVHEAGVLEPLVLWTSSWHRRNEVPSRLPSGEMEKVSQCGISSQKMDDIPVQEHWVTYTQQHTRSQSQVY